MLRGHSRANIVVNFRYHRLIVINQRSRREKDAPRLPKRTDGKAGLASKHYILSRVSEDPLF